MVEGIEGGTYVKKKKVGRITGKNRTTSKYSNEWGRIVVYSGKRLEGKPYQRELANKSSYEDKKIFYYMFWSFTSSILNFNYCFSVISIDGTFLRGENCIPSTSNISIKNIFRKFVRKTVLYIFNVSIVPQSNATIFTKSFLPS